MIVDQDQCAKDCIKIVGPTRAISNKAYEETLVDLDNGSKYSGVVINGMPNGVGKEYRKDGTLFSGMFRNGKWHGEGTITTKSLDIFKGEFINGHFCGV